MGRRGSYYCVEQRVEKYKAHRAMAHLRTSGHPVSTHPLTRIPSPPPPSNSSHHVESVRLSDFVPSSLHLARVTSLAIALHSQLTLCYITPLYFTQRTQDKAQKAQCPKPTPLGSSPARFVYAPYSLALKLTNMTTATGKSQQGRRLQDVRLARPVYR